MYDGCKIAYINAEVAGGNLVDDHGVIYEKRGDVFFERDVGIAILIPMDDVKDHFNLRMNASHSG